MGVPLTAKQIANIRHLRGCNVPWEVIAKQERCSVAECRQAIGLPTYSPPAPARRVLPWDQHQRELFTEPSDEGSDQ
jgi:hypothetical protein